LSSTSLADAGPTARPAGRTAPNRWLVLAIVCLGQFMVVLDATVVNVALPSIQRGLDFSDASLQWVINAYTLVFGGFLLLGGRAADLLGRKRLFVAGVALFTVASVINGFANSAGVLVAGRAMQGLGGALVSPAALSVLTTSFEDGRERTRALGVWSAIAAGGAAFGLLLGGVLTDLLSWSWIFFVNIPVGVAAVLLALRFVPESRVETRHRHFDLTGAVTVTGGLMLLVYAIVKARAWGWTSGRTLGTGAAALALLALFIVVELRSRSPLMRLGIFRMRPLAVANGTMLLVAAGMFANFYFVSLFVQDILRYGPLKAGLAFMPFSGGIVVGAGLAQRLIRKLAPRGVAALGLTLAAIGMLVQTRLPVDASYPVDLLSGLIPMSIGMGLTFVPTTLLATSGVKAADAGLASGLLNTMQQIGGSLGLAVLATVAVSRAEDHLTGLAAPPTPVQLAEAQVVGFHAAFVGSMIMLLAAAVLVLGALRRRDVAEVDLDASPVPAA
jgi:EmrB/QacA subfamily drug resistance transporter